MRWKAGYTTSVTTCCAPRKLGFIAQWHHERGLIRWSRQKGLDFGDHALHGPREVLDRLRASSYSCDQPNG